MVNDVVAAIEGQNPNVGLPPQIEEIWYLNQIKLSMGYQSGQIPGTSITDPVRKIESLNRINNLLRGKSNFSTEEFEAIMQKFEKRLEDPGFLENVHFFRLWESEFEIMFYILLWDPSSTAKAMLYVHNYGWDLNGNFMRIPDEDVWCAMSRFEHMNIDARKKASNIVKIMQTLDVKKAVSLGGGENPERFYGLGEFLEKMEKLSIFDTGNTSSPRELYPHANQRARIEYFRDNLFSAPKHCRDQDFVWMTGVWPYLPEEAQIGVLLGSAQMLKPNGSFVFDTVIKNASMLRVVVTQGWPTGGNGNKQMEIAENIETAVSQVWATIAMANAKLKTDHLYLDICDVNPVFSGPQPTSVQFRLKKRAI